MVNQFPAGQFNGPITCDTYQGCGDALVRWCEHKIPGFDGNNTHGWPGSAGKIVWDFWKSLKWRLGCVFRSIWALVPATSGR
jgi:hypothetical protein